MILILFLVFYLFIQIPIIYILEQLMNYILILTYIDVKVHILCYYVYAYRYYILIHAKCNF